MIEIIIGVACFCLGLGINSIFDLSKIDPSVPHEHTWGMWKSSVTFQSRSCISCGYSEWTSINYSGS